MPESARLGDAHWCPKLVQEALPSLPGIPVIPTVVWIPHIGGPVKAPGEPTVLIEGAVAARFTDLASCVGPIDAIAIGSPTVFIGGLLAARNGDACDHGGTVLAGAPHVIIGQGSPDVVMVRRGKCYIIVDRQNHRILIVGVQEYFGSGATAAYVSAAIANINGTWSGVNMFEGQPYTIVSMIQGRLLNPGDPSNPMANGIEVVHTTDPPSVTTVNDPSQQWPYGNGIGYQHDTDMQGGLLIPAHEFGHALGLQDEYKEDDPLYWWTFGILGQHKTTPTSDGLMARIDPGRRPTDANIDSLVNGNGLFPSFLANWSPGYTECCGVHGGVCAGDHP